MNGGVIANAGSRRPKNLTGTLPLNCNSGRYAAYRAFAQKEVVMRAIRKLLERLRLPLPLFA